MTKNLTCFLSKNLQELKVYFFTHFLVILQFLTAKLL